MQSKNTFSSSTATKHVSRTQIPDKNPPLHLNYIVLPLGRKERGWRQYPSQKSAPGVMKGWDHFRVFSTDLQSDFFFILCQCVVEILLQLKANICVCLKFLFNAKPCTSLIVCVMLLQLKRAVGKNYWFVAWFLLAFLLHHVYIMHNLCEYSFLGHVGLLHQFSLSTPEHNSSEY